MMLIKVDNEVLHAQKIYSKECILCGAKIVSGKCSSCGEDADFFYLANEQYYSNNDVEEV